LLQLVQLPPQVTSPGEALPVGVALVAGETVAAAAARTVVAWCAGSSAITAPAVRIPIATSAGAAIFAKRVATTGFLLFDELSPGENFPALSGSFFSASFPPMSLLWPTAWAKGTGDGWTDYALA
jgi:hypothetical protein